jgi:hypothetical protein
MKSLSAADESRVMAAIEKTADYVNGGLTPNDAIIKAAEEAQIPPGHVNLMVHAYNTGRTARQRQVGDTALEKAADFPLADAGVVLEALYPSQVKTAAQTVREHVLSPEYQLSPRGMLERRAAAEKRATAATVSLRMCDPPPPLPSDPTTPIKKAYALRERNNHRIDESRRQVSQAFDKLATSFQILDVYFRTPGSTPFPVASPDIAIRYGAEGERLLEKLAEVSPLLAKQAPRTVHDHERGYLKLAEDVLEDATTWRELRAAHEKLAAQLTAETEAALLPFVQPPSNSILDPSSDKQAAAAPFAWGMFGGAVGNGLNDTVKHMQPPTTQSLVQQNMSSLTDPQHEANLRNIRMQAMLQDLMTNDPVISGYDPDETLTAFNEIGEASPRAADQRLVMQTLLRKRLAQGVLDPFEVDQLLGIEGKLRSRDQGRSDASASVL